MERNEILKQIQEIFSDVLNDDQLLLTEQTTPDDIGEWDSLNHIQILMEIEKKYNIKFSAKETIKTKSISDIVDRIILK